MQGSLSRTSSLVTYPCHSAVLARDCMRALAEGDAAADKGGAAGAFLVLNSYFEFLTSSGLAFLFFRGWGGARAHPPTMRGAT